jgi:TolB protein
MYKWLLFFLLFAVPLVADEEIVVRLSNEESLAPLYLNPIEDIRSGFDASYLRALEKVLSFDLNHNGKTEVVSQSSARKEQAKREKGLHVFEREKWRELGCDYVVKAAISNKKFTTAVFSVSDGSIKGIDGVPLSGSLEEDRRLIHSIADSMHEALFNTRGVCGTRILYTVRTRSGSTSSEWVTEVWESDYDGANARQVTHHAGLCVTPTYIPAGQGERSRGLLYVCYQVGQPKIYAASAENGEAKRLTYLRGNQLMPAVSPKRDLIAFISDITGNPDLFVQDFSPEEGLIGKPRQIFCAPQAAQGTPTFSPDGKQLAFVSNKDGTPRIYALAIPRAGASIKEVRPQLISKQNRNNTCPAWSPDGTKIAYSATVGSVRQICVYDFTTGRETQLTDGYGHKENPTWAPDSLHLMFNSSTETASELFLINLNQKKAVKITSGPGEKRFPAWEPTTTRKI